MGVLNDTLKVKIEKIQTKENLYAPEVYAKKLLKLKAKHFKKLLNPDYCELDLSQFEKLNAIIEDASQVLIDRLELEVK